ncbi:MAG: photosynthetic complex assembly protein PuhC [Pseudomonadota bacterium]
MQDTNSPGKAKKAGSVVRPMWIVTGLLVAVLGLVAFARLTDRPLDAQPDRSEIIDERVLYISATLDGAARITGKDGEIIGEYPPGGANFIATMSRVVARERMKHKADQDAPVHLRRRAENRLTLFDPATGRETELSSFGKDNIAAFSVLLQRD